MIVSDLSSPNKKQKTSTVHSVDNYDSENSEQLSSDNYRTRQDDQNDWLKKLLFLSKRAGEGDQQVINEIDRCEDAVDFIKTTYQRVKKNDKSRERAKKYSTALLTPYRERNEKEYKRQLTGLFQEKFPSFLEVIFSSNEPDGFNNEQYKLCLYKFFVEFIDTEKFVNWEEDCRGILEWLTKNQIEEILQEKSEMKMIHFLVLNNNLAAIEWVFLNCDKQQTEEIFTYEDGKIFNLLAVGNGDDKQCKIINLVFKKFKELFVAEEQERQISEKKEQLKSQILENFEGEMEVWVELESKLIT